MIFVPLSLFGSLLLVMVFVWFARSHDLSHRAHQLFLALVALYATQSLLITVRWGYGVLGAAPLAALLAPVLPVAAYLSYSALTGPLKGSRLWPLIIIPLNWFGLSVARDMADAMILVTYLVFGALLIRLALKGRDQLALSPLENAREIVLAIALTGVILVVSALTDGYVIYDFMFNDGQHVGLIVGFVQSAFALVIGMCAAFGRVSPTAEFNEDTPVDAADLPTEQDTEVMAKLEELFAQAGVHRNEELSLRRLARRLGLPDRRVSNAINRSCGLSVSQFVNNYRIKDACRLLTTTQDTILAVSLAAGFATKSNFNREFIRVTGTSPSKWRTENSGPKAA